MDRMDDDFIIWCFDDINILHDDDRWQQEVKQRKEQQEQQHKYRDRAKERLMGLNPDYAQVTEELTEEQYKKLDEEATKYLGGDMDRTHLVKGLDYALLSKVRDQQEKELELKLERSVHTHTHHTHSLPITIILNIDIDF